MKAIPYSIGLLVIGYCLGGCASAPAPDTVKPVTVRVVGSDFCPIMRGVVPPDGTLTWIPSDSPETIKGVRDVNAAVAARCVPKKLQPRNE